MKIAGILVSIVAPFENHIANGGDKLLGNAGSIKRRPDGRVYISGQMQKHVFFSTLEKLNLLDPNRGDTFVSNGDAPTHMVEKDLRADLGGFMTPVENSIATRRTAPLSTTYAVAKDISNVGRDLMVRVQVDSNTSESVQALATKEYSERDLMQMNFHLDISSLSISRSSQYGMEGSSKNKNLNISNTYHKHATEEERKRRVSLFLNATRLMNDYANQARNAVCGEPEKVLIVFDPGLSRKAMRYFNAGEIEQKNILQELEDRNAKYFLGDDTTSNSVAMAYAKAFEFLNKGEHSLFDPSEKDANGKEKIESYGEVHKSLSPDKETKKSGKSKKTN